MDNLKTQLETINNGFFADAKDADKVMEWAHKMKEVVALLPDEAYSAQEMADNLRKHSYDPQKVQEFANSLASAKDPEPEEKKTKKAKKDEKEE